MIIKVQSAFRGHLTRKMVKKIRNENLVNAGMHDPNMMKGDFENEHVQVRIFFNKHFASYRLKESSLACSSLTPTSTSPALALASTRNKPRSKAAPSTRANGLKTDLM